MTREAQRPQTISPAALMQAAESVARGGGRRVVRVQGKALAIVAEPETAAEAAAAPTPSPGRKTGILSADDPQFRLAGGGDSGIEGGTSGRKHEYQGAALRHT